MEIESQWTSSYHNHKINKDQYRIYDADEVDKEIERLRKEQEWILDEVVNIYCATSVREREKVRLIAKMQQALKGE